MKKKKVDPGVVATRLEIQRVVDKANSQGGIFHPNEFDFNDFRALQVAEVNSHDPRRIRRDEGLI